MINFKQEELIDGLLTAIKQKFPEVKLVNITESTEDPDDIWVRVTAPEDEDAEIDLLHYAGEKCTDILMDYGYLILVMTTRQNNNSMIATQ